ncbi:MAG: 3-oxoacyl-[acyl-carrier-protein] synthase [Ilumatobacteraceae bacterium]|nr:3-oxoacyl-[acyl-carrier-protein] synthase [Ilumatobacteraceae bacterium]
MLGCGGHVPQRVVPNAELSAFVDTSDEWIVQRSGIRQRHIAAEGELTSDLATKAARAALAHAGVQAGEIDLVIVATSTPDHTLPATATKVQAQLGMTSGLAFDVQAACAGFVYAVSVADSMLKNGAGRTALVIGAETMSRIVDWTDRTTCVLFGDGAGAIVLRLEAGTGSTSDRGVLASMLHSDGRLHDLLYADGGPSSGTTGHLRMHGQEVYRHAVTKLSGVVTEVLDAAGLSASDVDWVIPHQANSRIIGSVAGKLGLGMDRVVVTVDQHANTSAASIPLALTAAVADGRIKPGDLLLFEAIGGGMTWGANLLRW